MILENNSQTLSALRHVEEIVVYIDQYALISVTFSFVPI